MPVSCDIALACGLVDSTGSRHRRVRIRPPTGHVELALALGGGDRLDDAERDELLAACVARIGGFTDVTPELVAALTRGDRARLALAIRATLVGEAVLLVLECPAAGCSTRADLTLHTPELLGDNAIAYPLAMRVSTGDGELDVRPPTGADERAARGSDDELWGRLVSRDGHPLGPAAWLALEPASAQEVAIALAALDPCADLSFASTCPQCGTWLEVEVDPVDLLFRTLATGERRLLAEVHSLAFHYSWAEADILSLPRMRRFSYLELLRDHLEGRPLTGAGV